MLPTLRGSSHCCILDFSSSARTTHPPNTLLESGFTRLHSANQTEPGATLSRDGAAARQLPDGHGRAGCFAGCDLGRVGNSGQDFGSSALPFRRWRHRNWSALPSRLRWNGAHCVADWHSRWRAVAAADTFVAVRLGDAVSAPRWLRKHGANRVLRRVIKFHPCRQSQTSTTSGSRKC